MTRESLLRVPAGRITGMQQYPAFPTLVVKLTPSLAPWRPLNYQISPVSIQTPRSVLAMFIPKFLLFLLFSYISNIYEGTVAENVKSIQTYYSMGT